MGLSGWLSIGSSVAISFILTLYAKPLTKWREAREKSWSAFKTAREERYLNQALLYVKNPASYTDSQIDYASQLIIAFGSMIMGVLSIIFGHIFLAAPTSGFERLMTYVFMIFGGLLYGTGFAILVGLQIEHKRKMRASAKVRAYLDQRDPESDDAASLQSIIVHTPSDPSGPQI